MSDQAVTERSRAEAEAESALLARLDAYGHCSYSVGGTYDDGGDWTAFADYAVGKVAGRTVVAYHVVVNSDRGGFIETTESGVVDASDAPKGLLLKYIDLALEAGNLDADCLKDSEENAERFDNDMQKAIAR